MFAAINNLIKSGVTDINDFLVSEYIQQNNPNWLNIYNPKNEDMDYIQNIKDLGNPNNFIYHYNRLKKFSFLRELSKEGYNINNFYDITEENRELNRAFEEADLTSLINDFMLKQLSIKENWLSSSEESESFRPDDSMYDLFNELQQTPSFGYPFCEELAVLTQVTRGLRAGKLYIQSGSTGSGKSRMAMKFALNSACSHMYDTNTNTWKDIGDSIDTLFISTELDRTELITMAWSMISGVEEDKILEGTYNESEKERVLKAIEVLKASKIHFEYCSDFDIESINSIIEKHIIKNNIEFCYFDYIHMSSSLLTSLKKKTGTSLREDQVLMLLTASLKEICNKYSIAIYTSTQLNRQAIENKGEIGLNVIRGSFALADKCDYMGIIVPPTAEERVVLKTLGLIQDEKSSEVNTVIHVRKNRGGKYNNIRIYLHINKGNMRSRFIGVLDDNLSPITLTINKFELPKSERSDEKLMWLNTRGNFLNDSTRNNR